MPRLSLPARLAACLLMLAGFLTIPAPADAAVPDRNFCGLNTFWTNSTSGPDLIVRDVNCFTNAGAAVNTGFTVSANSIL